MGRGEEGGRGREVERRGKGEEGNACCGTFKGKWASPRNICPLRNVPVVMTTDCPLTISPVPVDDIIC